MKTNKQTWGSRRLLPQLWSRLWVRISLIVLVVIMVLSVLAPVLNPLIFSPARNTSWGASFSIKQAENLGLDWRKAYTALLDDMGLRKFRLMSYWDTIEAERGKFTFDDLDWQIAEAKKRGAEVSLSIGVRQPRWPECFQPDWASSLDGGAWKQALYAYLEQVVKRYRSESTIISWQLENEAMNNWFGECDPPDRQRIIEEFNLVKSWAPNREIWMSLSDQHGLPFNDPKPDRYGFSVYRQVYSSNIIQPGFYITYPTPIWYHRARAAAIELMQNRKVFIHELQLEPWGPRDTKFLSVEEQNKSMSVNQIGQIMYFARMIGSPDIYLWGSEWWYWRKVNGDASIWNEVKRQISPPTITP